MARDPFFVSEELLGEWYEEWQRTGGSWPQFAATQAARWGADQELEACCEWLLAHGYDFATQELHYARRPKPPSLKEQALLQLDTLNADLAMHGMGCDLSQIRRALEQLND